MSKTQWGTDKSGFNERQTDGKFRKSQACDCCGKPVGSDYCTDDEVCGGSDGPGFFLCDRKRCTAKLEGLDVEARRALCTAQRAANEAAR